MESPCWLPATRDFKGSWLTRMLTLAGARVTGYSLNPPTDPSLFEIAGLEDTMDSVIGDVRDLARLQEVFERVQPQVVFHLAAQPLCGIPTRTRCTPMRPM